MKVFSVIGISKSGKTTTVENVIKELKKRRYTVGSVKEIHFEDFAIDEEGTNTYRHKIAGAQLVSARGYHETDILFPEKLSIDKLLSFYEQDYVVLEGVRDGNIPKIVTAHTVEEIEERFDEYVFCISGRIADEIKEYKGVPVINCLTETEKLTDLIEEKVFEKLPDFPVDCCGKCGYDCRTLGINILKGKAKREDCILSKGNTKLYIDGQEIQMVPFVQKLLYNSVLGIVKELDGYKENGEIVIKM